MIEKANVKSDKDIVLSVKNLKKNFGDNSVLNGIDIEIFKGDVVAVVGPSSSCSVF